MPYLNFEQTKRGQVNNSNPLSACFVLHLSAA